MSFHYRITKYDPKNRDNSGAYLNDEWTAYTDIGKLYSGKRLSLDQYLATENLYIESIFRFMNCNRIATVRINDLEKKCNPKHDQNTASIMTELFEKVKEGDVLGREQLDALCRLILREFLWCKLKNSETLEVHFGYDYYMYVVSKSRCKIAIEKIDGNGLFVEQYKSPYFINKTFTNSIDIGTGVITYNEFDLETALPPLRQLNCLREDLLQIKFGEHLLIDVGWHPKFDLNGSFVVRVIRNYDWQEPIEEIRVKTFEALKIAIEQAAASIIENDQSIIKTKA